MGRSLLYSSLSDWANFEKENLVRINPICSKIRILKPASQLRVLFCALNDAFIGRIICWHPPRAWDESNRNNRTNTELLGELSEYVFLRDFVFQDYCVCTSGLEIPRLLKPWTAEDSLRFQSFPAYLQMKLMSLDLNVTWLYAAQQEDIMMLFSNLDQ